MFKKIIYGLLFSVLIIGQLTFTSDAVGQSENLTFNVNYPQPYCSDTTGYISVVYRHAVNDYRLNTLFWSMEPESNEVYGTEFTNVMDITITGSIMKLEPYVLGGSYWYNLYEFSSADTLSRLHSGYHNSILGTPMWSYNYGNIVAVLFNGNVGAVNLNGISFDTPVIHWSNSSDSNQIYNYMWQILQSLQGVEGDTTEIISKLNSILTENVTTNQKLEDIKALYEQLIEEQQESNTWLEKIFNFLSEKDEKDKEQAQTQGSSSVSQGTSSIEDKGTGFVDSMGGLVSSMSYSGVDCSWTFPQVKLPAIDGVMEECVLIEEQPIDFTRWINAIPAPILLLIQSVLTMGLIVYCFKELYDTISYVLTLRGGGSNE